MRVSRRSGVSVEHFQAVPRHVERIFAPGLNLDNSYKDIHHHPPSALTDSSITRGNLHFIRKASHSDSIFWRHGKCSEKTMNRSIPDLKNRIFIFFTQKSPKYRTYSAIFKIMPVNPAELRGIGLQISSQASRNRVCSLNWVTACIGKLRAKLASVIVKVDDFVIIRLTGESKFADAEIRQIFSIPVTRRIENTTVNDRLRSEFLARFPSQVGKAGKNGGYDDFINGKHGF